MFQENSIKTYILSRVKQITSPGWMHETSARTWCTGKTQRILVEREVGGRIGMGNTCKPMAVSFQCMTKSTTIKKKKRQLGLPRLLSGKEPTCQGRGHGSDTWVREIPWRRKWQPIPVFLTGKSHGLGSLMDCSPWGHKRVGHNFTIKHQAN